MSVLPKPSEAAQIAAASYVGPWRWESPGHTRAIDATLGGYRCCAFEGTTRDGLAILRDIRFVPWIDRAGIGPAGFVKGLGWVIEQIIADTIDDAKAGRLLFIGHSLGAALALRCAAYFVSLGYPPAGVYAFEPPRCGGARLRKLLRQIPTFITRDGNDPVTQVPCLYSLPAPVTKIGLPKLDPFRCHRIAVVTEDLEQAGF